jgi:FkbM family methyltransferase
MRHQMNDSPLIARRIVSKFQAEGIRGVWSALTRRLGLQRDFCCHPVQIAINELGKDKGFCVIQIGAYIGNSANDPLYGALRQFLMQDRGALIAVEPVKAYYDELVRNYSDVPGVVCENVAIAEENGTKTMYRLGIDPRDYGYPDWLSQLSSLKEERMGELWDSYELKNEGGNEYREFYLGHRIEELVNCITFDELLVRHRVSDIDLLQIDVEGYEMEILETIDFRKHSIRFVNYESALLYKKRERAAQLLRSNGYILVDYGLDTFCYKREDKRLFPR